MVLKLNNSAYNCNINNSYKIAFGQTTIKLPATEGFSSVLIVLMLIFTYIKNSRFLYVQFSENWKKIYFPGLHHQLL